MIHKRIHLATTRPPAPEDPAAALELEDSYNAAVNAEIIAGAREASVEHGGLDVVRVEVFHPEETEATDSWDALEVDLSANPPTLTTLPPYAEVAP